jgi:hypothetical protein
MKTVPWLGGLLLIASTLGAQSREAGRIVGTVTDSAGAPLSGVIVEIVTLKRRAVSSENGGYLLDSVPATSHLVRFRRLGYRGVESQATPGLGSAFRLDVRLMPASRSLRQIDTIALSRGVTLEARAVKEGHAGPAAPAGVQVEFRVRSQEVFNCRLELAYHYERENRTIDLHILGALLSAACPEAIGEATTARRDVLRPGRYRLSLRVGAMKPEEYCVIVRTASVRISSVCRHR